MKIQTKPRDRSDSASGSDGTSGGSSGGLRELERELLTRLKARGNKLRIRDLFEGFTPLWAVSAAGRAVDAGRATRDRDGKYTVTASGFAWIETDVGLQPKGGD